MKDNQNSPTSVAEDSFFPKENTKAEINTKFPRFFTFSSYVKAFDNFTNYPELVFGMSMALHNIKNAEKIISFVKAANQERAKNILDNYYEKCLDSFDVTDQKLIFLNSHGINTDEYCKKVFNLSMEENDLKSANDMLQFLKENDKENLAQEIVNEHKLKIAQKERFYDLMVNNDFNRVSALIIDLDKKDKDSLITNYMKDAISYNTLPLEMDRAKFLIQDLGYDPYKKYGDNKESVFQLAEKQGSLQTLTLINKIKSSDKEITNRVEPSNTLNVDEIISTLSDLSEESREKLEKDIKELNEDVKKARKQPKSSELITDINQPNVSESLARAESTLKEKVKKHNNLRRRSSR